MSKKLDPADELPPVDWSCFQGLEAPSYTQTPDEIFDWIMAYLTGAELKVLLYITRRTFGFKKASDAIALDQLCHGIVTRDGRRLDIGTGLKRPTVQEALRSLRTKNLIVAHQQGDAMNGSRPTVYALNLRRAKEQGTSRGIPGGMPEYTPDNASAGGGVYSYMPRRMPEEAPGVRPDTLPPYAIASPQQTVEQQTDNQERDKSKSSKPPVPDASSQARAELRQHSGQALYSPHISEIARDLSRMFHDADHERSNRTRALRLWNESTMDETTFTKMMYEARGVTQKRGNIEREATDGSPAGTRNRMPYFFSVLEDFIDMAREGSS